MGCDIHVYVERQHKRKGWVPVDPPRKHPAEWYLDEHGRRDYSKHDPTDWGRWMEPESALKALADVVIPELEKVPEQAQSWAFSQGYSSFAQLAGVRSRDGTEPPIEPRGVPDDISDLLFGECWMEDSKWGGRTTERHGRIYCWHPDWHTPHWYDLYDMEEFCRNGSFSEARIHSLWQEMERVARKYGLGALDVRVVFWFDN